MLQQKREAMMGLLRKLIKVGHSYMITVPMDWVKLIERRTGKIPELVSLSVNTVLQVRAIIDDGEVTSNWIQTRKQQLMSETNSCCQSCGKLFTPESLCIHHILPISKDGDDTVENTMLICPMCHGLAHTDMHKVKVTVSKFGKPKFTRRKFPALTDEEILTGRWK